MTIRIEELESKEKNQWNDFVNSHVDATPFSLWEYGEVLSSAYGYKRYYLAARYGEKLVGVFPLILIESNLFGRRLLSLPFCEYGGPLIDPEDSTSLSVAKKFLDEIHVLATSLKVDYVEIRNPRLGHEIFSRRAYESVQKYVNFDLELSGDEKSISASLNKKTRNSIRKAMRSNVRVHRVIKDSELREYFHLYLVTQRKHGSPPHSYEFFSNLLRKMKRNIKISLATYDNASIGGIIAFYNKHHIYWWSGVSDPKFRSLNGTSMLLWHVIRQGSRSRHLSLSLGRTRIDDGIYHFKKDWGGEETHLTDYVCRLGNTKAAPPDPSEGKYKLLTSIWSRLPIPMTKLLGPTIIKQIGL